MATKPLPPVQQDPAFLKAQAVHDTFDEELQRIRQDFTTTDLAKAQEITKTWRAANDQIAAAWQDLTARRQARRDELQKVLPVGPNLPDGISPADKAVLQQAFRASLTEARNATTDELQPMFRDALKFDDDLVIRAVLTTLVERGRTDLVRAWWTDRSGESGQLDELADLATFGGWGYFVKKAFAPIPKPQEVEQLPALQEAAEFQARSFNQNRGAAQRPMAMPPRI